MRRVLSLLMGLLCLTVGRAQPKYEIRASWVTTLGGLDWPSVQVNAPSPQRIEKQKAELIEILDKLKAAHFNTVLLQTRIRGDLIYPSQYEPWADCLTGTSGRNPGYDPLQFAIEACHERGMEVHAWMVCVPIGANRQIRLQGAASVVKRRPDLCVQYKDTWYLNPGNPHTADYLARLAKELVSRYDIDGVHLDYIRYPQGARQFPDRKLYARYGHGLPEDEWRRNNITRIVRAVYNAVKDTKPWVKISCSPIGKYRDTNRYPSRGWNAYDIVYQDAQKWLKEGYMDALFPMMYFQKNDFYPFALDWEEQRAGRWVVPGLGIYFLSENELNWPLEEVVRQIAFTRHMGLSGHAFFRNRYLMQNIKGLYDELAENFYTYPALVPPMTWQDSIPPTQPANPSTHFTADMKAQLAWSAATDEAGLPLRYRLYGADSFPVNTAQIRCLLADGIRSTQYLYTPSRPGLLYRYYAVTAVDRYGNESPALALNRPDSTEPHILNRGTLVYLPRLAHATRVSIENAWGETLHDVPYTTQLDISMLPGGYYNVFVTDRAGMKKKIGIVIR